MQSDFRATTNSIKIPLKDLEATSIAARELGVKVVVSELDIDVVLRGRWWADGGKYREELAKYDPYRDGCPLRDPATASGPVRAAVHTVRPTCRCH